MSRAAEGDALIADLFRDHATELVRMARLFVVDRNAAEDLVQEAFIRLSRSLDRIRDDTRMVAYLRSIVLNLARDHNRRGLVSLRHQPPANDLDMSSVEDQLVGREDQQIVLDALAALPLRQRDCLTLRYLLDLGIPEIAETLELSPNSVKTHLQRGLASLEQRLEGHR
jgi:RNA polymerase sigma factor (sigma-70 family)